jgi:hypothetical protein
LYSTKTSSTSLQVLTDTIDANIEEFSKKEMHVQLASGFKMQGVASQIDLKQMKFQGFQLHSPSSQTTLWGLTQTISQMGCLLNLRNFLHNL